MGSSLLLLLQAVQEHFHDINQDLLEEVLTCLSSEQQALGSTVKLALMKEPSLVLFKLAMAMSLSFEGAQEVDTFFERIMESDNPECYICYFLQMLTPACGELTREQWQVLVDLDNLYVCKYATEYAVRNLSYDARCRLIDTLGDTGNISLAKMASSSTEEISKYVAAYNTRSPDELVEAIHRSIGYSESLTGCSCSKHYECHDY